MKKFEELTRDELKALYDEKIKQSTEKEERNKKRWRAEIGGDYWYIDAFGAIYAVTDERNSANDYHYNIGNYFKTAEQAEEYKKKLLLQQAYKDWCAYDYNLDEPMEGHLYAYWNAVSGAIEIDDVYCVKLQGTIYAENVKRIREFINKIGEEDFKKYILEVE